MRVRSTRFLLQLKDGKYQADLTIQMAEDLLSPEISGKVKNVAQKCRNAGDGKSGLDSVNPNEILVFTPASVRVG